MTPPEKETNLSKVSLQQKLKDITQWSGRSTNSMNDLGYKLDTLATRPLCRRPVFASACVV